MSLTPRPFSRGPAAAPMREQTATALFRWWLGQPFEYGWVHAYAESHAWLRVDRLLVATAYALFCALGLTLLISQRPGPAVLTPTVTAVAVFAVLAWWWWADFPWPTERASLWSIAIGEMSGVALAAAAPSGTAALALLSLYVLPGFYIMFLHSPRVMLAHHLWVLVVVGSTGGYVLVATDTDPVTAAVLMGVQVFVGTGGLIAGQIAVTFLRADARGSFTDPLTGLLNRRGLYETVSHSATRYRPDDVVSVVMADVDSFKPVNDSLGHREGDEILIGVARVLVATCDGDAHALSRIGGDEFVVITHLDPAAASGLANRVRAAVLTMPARVGLTISLGVHTSPVGSWPPTAAAVDALLERADAALYSSKRAGGNTVTATISGQLSM